MDMLYLIMAGNVSEWCQDWYDSDQTAHVLRGGSWLDNADYLRVAFRFNSSPARPGNYACFGFRCVSGFPVAQQ